MIIICWQRSKGVVLVWKLCLVLDTYTHRVIISDIPLMLYMLCQVIVSISSETVAAGELPDWRCLGLVPSDFRNDYKTLYPWYMESIWWVFKQLYTKGLVYRGFKVMPFSTGCSTPLSNFESGQNYKDVVDPAGG